LCGPRPFYRRFSATAIPPSSSLIFLTILSHHICRLCLSMCVWLCVVRCALHFPDKVRKISHPGLFCYLKYSKIKRQLHISPRSASTRYSARYHHQPPLPPPTPHPPPTAGYKGSGERVVRVRAIFYLLADSESFWTAQHVHSLPVYTDTQYKLLA